MKKIIRIGTRGSPLALIQAEEARTRLLAAYPGTLTRDAIEIVPMRTGGDWKPEDKERSFIELGGNKELFTKKIQDALLAGTIDIAVHSLKDLAAFPPEDLIIAAVMEREDPRDAFICKTYPTLDALPSGALVGTSSLRRQAQVLAHRPDLRVQPLRGNVDTRLRKLADGMADATLLAVAGLNRLGLTESITAIMDTTIMLPCAAQGALGLEIRRNDAAMRDLVAPLNHGPSAQRVQAERAMLKVLDGTCKTPIAALAEFMPDGKIMLEGLVAKPNGKAIVRMSNSGSDPEAIGAELGHRLKGQLPQDFFVA